MKLAYIALAAALLGSGGAHAAAFQNGSFESGNFTDNTGAVTDRLDQGNTDMTGWTVVGHGNIAWEMNGNPYSASASDGLYALDLTGYTDSSPYGGVEQTFDTVAGHLYSLSYDVGNSVRYNDAAGAGVAASINGAQIIDFTNSAYDPVDPSQSFFTTATTSFTASGSSTTLDLIGSHGGYYIGLDNVRVADITPSTGAVPEPATWATMILGLGLIGGTLRWARRSDERFTRKLRTPAA